MGRSDEKGLPAFRLIAIAGDMDRIDRVHEYAAGVPDLPLGLMLRDVRHRPGRVATLCMYAAELGLPPNVTLIANGVSVRTARLTHRTAKDLAAKDRIAIDPASIPLPSPPFGASAHSIEEAERAARLGALYITLSPIFPTLSKPGHPGIGLEVLAGVAAALPVPIFALGGITTLAAVQAALGAGAHGIASISLFAPNSAGELDRVAQHIAGRYDDRGA